MRLLRNFGAIALSSLLYSCGAETQNNNDLSPSNPSMNALKYELRCRYLDIKEGKYVDERFLDMDQNGHVELYIREIDGVENGIRAFASREQIRSLTEQSESTNPNPVLEVELKTSKDKPAQKVKLERMDSQMQYEIDEKNRFMRKSSIKN